MQKPSLHPTGKRDVSYGLESQRLAIERHRRLKVANNDANLKHSRYG
jgi:hypothetical protein